MKSIMVGVMVAGLAMTGFSAALAGEEVSAPVKDQVRERKHEGEGRGGMRHGKPGEMMKKADKDGDGKVTEKEFMEMNMERLKALFTRLDMNKDGVLDASDREAARAARESKEGGKEAVAPAPAE